jgi:hypothetical protein
MNLAAVGQAILSHLTVSRSAHLVNPAKCRIFLELIFSTRTFVQLPLKNLPPVTVADVDRQPMRRGAVGSQAVGRKNSSMFDGRQTSAAQIYMD